MDIKDIQRERNITRNAIYRAIEIEIEKLREKTGLSIESISIDMKKVMAYEDEFPVYVLESVDCKLAIQ